PPQPADLDRLDSAGADKCVHDGSADPETLGGLLNRQHQGDGSRNRIGSRRKELVEVIITHGQAVLSLRCPKASSWRDDRGASSTCAQASSAARRSSNTTAAT